MLHNTVYQGKGINPSPFASPPDSRIADIAQRMQLENPGAYGRPFSDPFRVGRPELISLDYTKPIVIGRVIYAVPHINCYYVRLGSGGGLTTCIQMATTNIAPVGVRDSAMIAPGSPVLVQADETSAYGVILGVLPVVQENAANFRPGYVWLGSGVGPQREPVYAEFLRSVVSGRDAPNVGTGSPLDGTSLDRGFFTETGLQFHIDPFLTFWRASPRTSILMSLFDEYMRIQAAQFEMVLPTTERVSKNDEGELHDIERNFTFPWEAVGLYGPGTYGKRFTDVESQLDGYTAPIDLDPAARDLQPFARHTVYRGQLGNPYLETLAVPGRFSGQQLRRDLDTGKGVYSRSLGLDGSVLEQSVTSITSVKKPNIPLPKQVRLPEDTDGDDRRDDNYAFDRTEPRNSPPDPSVLSADPLNASAYEANDKALQAIRDHTGDFSVREEKTSGPDQPVLDYSAFAALGSLPIPGPVDLQLDWQGTMAAIHALSSVIRQNEDGSVSIVDGTGCGIFLRNGRLELQAPEGVYLRAGMRVVVMANDIYLRGHDNVDITASNKEVRIAAHRKIQILGNSLLLESRGEATDIDYSEIGENVKSSGIILKANTSVSLLGNGLLLRSGVASTNGKAGLADDTGSGSGTRNIVIDAAGREADIIVTAGRMQLHATDGFSVRTSPKVGGKLGASYHFLSDGVSLGGKLDVSGKITGYGKSGLSVEGDIKATGSSSAGTRLFHNSEKVGTVPASYTTDIQRLGTTVADKHKEQDSLLPEAGLVDDRTMSPLPTREQLAVQFTFRDSDTQYRTAETYSLSESRWEQLARFGGAGGVAPWNENPLLTSYGQQAPFPGYRVMTGGTGLRRMDKTVYYDYAAGHADISSVLSGSVPPAQMEVVDLTNNLGTI